MVIERAGSADDPAEVDQRATDRPASDAGEAESTRYTTERDEGAAGDKNAETPYSPLEHRPSHGGFATLADEFDARRQSRQNADASNVESSRLTHIEPDDETTTQRISDFSIPDEKSIEEKIDSLSPNEGSGHKDQFRRDDKDVEGTVDAVRYLDAHKLRTPAGEAFYGVHDIDMRRVALSLHPEQGKFTADLHGTPESVNVEGRSLTAHDLASFLESDKSDWRGEPIRLFSCNTGKGDDPFAQKLADRLGVPVTAPTELAWSDISGNSWSATKTKNAKGDWVSTWPPDGKWVTFSPREQSGEAL